MDFAERNEVMMELFEIHRLPKGEWLDVSMKIIVANDGSYFAMDSIRISRPEEVFVQKGTGAPEVMQRERAKVQSSTDG